ncbi:glycosyltransferase family 9 protein [Thermodesulfovibrio sp. Kuro-1]|uniref:glycosyltransferase family 9 protein n=1 Tax=Thermodesulfovibrio sp. Kuro-1 TaxID=2580394 RepID=UPI001142DF84|nr:glycosyltransferase family 9 protein [Thermodesulfovibrio sp. Kuro-1]
MGLKVLAKDIVKLSIHTVINSLIKPSQKVEHKSMLIIRLDAIGDYILFRNFIKILKDSDKFKGYKITLLGNIAWKELAETLDSKEISHFIWLDRKKFAKNPYYRLKKLKEITAKGYELVISPVYSREFYYCDTIIKLISAGQKIGSSGNLSNIKKWQKRISDKFYTKLIPAKDEIIFEFYRNKEFFEYLLQQQITLRKPFIQIPDVNLSFELPKKYAVLFIGGSASFRKWSIENFAKVGLYLKDTYGYNIVLCGSKTDLIDSESFRRSFKKSYVDLVGKTNLIELLQVINSAEIIISNETVASHMAVALDKRVIVISNGNHFGRFTPYPKEITSNYFAVYHSEIEKNLDDYKKLSNTYGFISKLNINEITFEMVKVKIDELLNDLKKC